MMRAMYSGVAGLKTHQTKMDVIGNNIANVNTVAFKSQSVTFSELMYQTTQKASGPNAMTGTGGINARQIGLGVKSGAINTNISSQGASQTTNNPFDIMITGDAFFIVSDGANNFFTRDGSFYVDGAGNLAMTSNGFNVMGWGVDPETQNIRQDNVAALRIMSPENMTYPPEATSKAYVSGIIDKNDVNVTSSSGKSMNLQFYDSLGYSYTAKLVMKSTDKEGEYSLELGGIMDENNEPIQLPDNMAGLFGDTGTVNRETALKLDANKYKWDGADLKKTDGTTMVCQGATIQKYIADPASLTDDEKAEMAELAKAYGFSSPEEMNNLKIQFSDTAADGTVTTGTMTVLQVLVNADITVTGTTTKKAQDLAGFDGKDITAANFTANQMDFTGYRVVYDASNGKFVGLNGNLDEAALNLSGLTVTTPDGQQSKFSDIKIDFSTTTMFNNSGSSTIAATSGDTKGIGSGRKLGEMSGISVQNNGLIYASYDNGQTRLLGQIAVAEFANASGLEKEGDNLYSATLNSGEFDGIGVDITANGGYMNTGVLEMSNVDLSAEFTEMITTQRGFQANSRIITVSDTLLEELVNLKR